MFRLSATQKIYSVDRFHDDGANSLSVINVGYDDDENKSYSVSLGLCPQPGGGVEFFFQIVEADGETNSEHIFWSGKDVAAFIPKEARETILAIIASETEVLLNAVRPTRVNYVTIDEYPPDRALVKHFVIADVFQLCGYSVKRGDPYHGKHVWVMELLPENGS